MWDLICTKFRANGILFVVNRGNNAATPNLFYGLLLFFRVCKKIVAKRSVTCFGAFGTVKGIMQMATSASP